MLRFRSFGLWMLLWFTFASSWSVADFVGNVSAVHDGDTITVLTADKRSVKVRLFGIDAPESGQAYSRRAKQRLGELVFGKRVRVVSQGRDRYGRVLGIVYLGRKDINAQMVEEGLAWAYVEYSGKYIRHQKRAKAARRNIWSEDRPVPPWDWRRGDRTGRESDSVTKVTPQEYTVYITPNGKRYHRAGCRHLSRDAIPVSLSEAVRRGYTPCKVCISR